MFKLSGAILVVFAPGFPIIRVRSLYVDRRRSSETIYLWLVILNNERWKQMSRNWISLSCNKDARRDYLTGEILGSAVCCHGTQWEVWLFDNLTFWLFLTISLFLTIWLFLTFWLFDYFWLFRCFWLVKSVCCHGTEWEVWREEQTSVSRLGFNTNLYTRPPKTNLKEESVKTIPLFALFLYVLEDPCFL